MQPATDQHRATKAIIFLTIFVSMTGFGIVIPVLPDYARYAPFQLSPVALGWLTGVFSLVQLFTAPLLGKLSDRIGRKPVLLISVIGTALGYFITGAAAAPWMLFLGRIIDGASGGNIAAAQASMADITTPENRSRSMGLIGAAFGLGFVFGPAIGGVLGEWHHAAPFYFAGLLAVVNALLIVRFFPETLSEEKRLHPDEAAPLAEVVRGPAGGFIATLLVATLLSTTGFASIHLLLSLFCVDQMGFTRAQVSYAFAYMGLLGVFVQGGLLRQLLQCDIEKPVAVVGALLLGLSLWLLPQAHTLGQFLGTAALMALGNGLLVPTLSGMASRHVHGRAQGRVLGLNAAVGSIGRGLGPLLAALPLPLGFSDWERSQGLAAELRAQVEAGYATAFSIAAALLFATALVMLAMRVPREPAGEK